MSTCAIGDQAETMVFNNVTDETDVFSRDFTRRHKTRDDALKWHGEVVEKLREKFA